MRAVGVLLPHGYRFCVALFAVMESGAAAVPLDPRWPAARIAQIAETSGVTTIITLGRYGDLARSLTPVCELVILDDPADPHVEAVREPPEPAFGGARSERYAYIVFTSGTTGRSKGVPISHDNLMPLLRWQEEAFGLGPHLRSVQVLPITFDFGLEEILNLLCFGGTLVVPSDEERLTPERYGVAMRTYGATMLYTTPAFLRQLFPHAAFSQLQLVLVGGETFDLPLAEAVASRVREPAKVFNGYGPTEVTITATTHRVTGRERDEYPAARSLPIGRPCASNAVYVLDEQLRPVPVGVVGEIYVGGPGVADGYLGGSPDDDTRFTIEPLAGQAGMKLYRTGDAARYLHDGTIEFVSRLDRQVKIRGYRVEPNEVAAVLAGHPGVVAAHVEVERDVAGEARLVAYCVAADPSSELHAALQALVDESLPRYMIPRLRFVGAIPLNENGKVDVDALRRLAPRADVTLPGDEREDDTVRAVLAVWRRVLDRPELRADDNVFEFGAHSLNVGNAYSALSANTPYEFPLVRLFECYTARKLGESLKPQLGGSESAEESRGGIRRRALARTASRKR